MIAQNSMLAKLSVISSFFTSYKLLMYLVIELWEGGSYSGQASERKAWKPGSLTIAVDRELLQTHFASAVVKFFHFSLLFGHFLIALSVEVTK